MNLCCVQSLIVKEPYGVVLIISPWNYPISLILNPLVRFCCVAC